MTVHIHALVQWQIRALFLGRLPPSKLNTLWSQLGACSSCARLYSRYSRLEMALGGRKDGPTAFALERVQGAVFHQLRFETTESSAAPRLGIKVWAMLASAALAALVVVGWRGLQKEERSSNSNVIAMRGGPSGASTDVGIRMLRLRTDGGGPQEASTLSLIDVVTFTSTHLNPELRYLMLFGVQKDGSVRWYYPGAESEESVPLRDLGVDIPLGDGFRLGGAHVPGWLSVTALFSKEPLRKSDIEAVVEQNRGTAAESGALEFARDGVLQHSIRVQLVAE